MIKKGVKRLNRIDVFVCPTCSLATYVCPLCRKPKAVDVTRFDSSGKTVKLEGKCSCGCAYTLKLEKRRHQRKEAHLPGEYTHIVDKKQVNKGAMVVTDISRSGLKIKLAVNVIQYFKLTDKLRVSFKLDDQQGSLIKKAVDITGLNGTFISGQFSQKDPCDENIGFYLSQVEMDVAHM